MKAVFNSSPVIFLSKLNVIDQDVKLFNEITIPVYVREEISRKEDIASDKVKDLLESKDVIVVTLPSNKEYSIPQIKMLLNEIERGISKKISLQQWENL